MALAVQLVLEHQRGLAVDLEQRLQHFEQRLQPEPEELELEEVELEVVEVVELHDAQELEEVEQRLQQVELEEVEQGLQPLEQRRMHSKEVSHCTRGARVRLQCYHSSI